MTDFKALRRAAICLVLTGLTACQGGRDTAATPALTDPVESPTRAQDESKSLAGVAVVDASWHFGASAGQFSATGHGIDNGRGYDPYVHAIRKVGSDILGSRITARALVTEGANGKRLAIVANDLYLPNDFLRRRLAQLLAAHDANPGDDPVTGITQENLAVTVSHSHTSPFYSTPAFGPWIFQDVYDLRFYEYMAEKMRDAVVAAVRDLRPARVGGTAFYANDIRGHTYGAKVSPLDNTPAGQPRNYTTRQAYLLSFEDAASGDNFANWVVLGVHPEWVWGEEIMNGDVTHAIMRSLDRETGAVTIMSQSETGTSGPHKDERAHYGAARREYQESNLAGADRAARIFADNVLAAREQLVAGQAWDRTQFAPMRADFEVDSAFQRFAPPATRPLPGVSNCNSDRLFYEANPSVVYPTELPECKPLRDSDAEPLFELIEPLEEMLPVQPADITSALADQLIALGVPVPTSYSTPSLVLLEEQATVPILSARIGDMALTFCPCEQFTDTALNIISRLNTVAGDLHTGWDWDLGYPDDPRKPDEIDLSADFGCWQSGDDEWSCPHPSPHDNSVLTMTALAYQRMKAQIHNDAGDWEDLQVQGLHAEAEPADPEQIRGNFRHEELTEYGYALVVPVGMANDYWGYMPAYREYRAHDHYRKSLAGLGPHGADFLATRLSRLAASLKGHPGMPASVLDTAYLLEDARGEVLSRALGEAAIAARTAYEAVIPDDGGSPSIVEQPVDTERFDAAFVRFVGGSSYEGMPEVQVQRQVDGNWRTFESLDGGGVQLQLKFPGATVLAEPDDVISIPDVAELTQWAAGNFEWVWTANFEAFVADIALRAADEQPVPGHFATPTGEYRFVIRGRHRSGGVSQPYELISDSFHVTPWTGITATDLTVDGPLLHFTSGPRTEHSLFQRGADGDDIETTPRIVGPVDYPDSYDAPISWIRNTRNLHTYNEGEADDQQYCHRCSFRPWADVTELNQACAALFDGEQLVDESCDASRDVDGRWTIRFTSTLARGDQVVIRPGDLQDRHGNVNGAAIALDGF